MYSRTKSRSTRDSSKCCYRNKSLEEETDEMRDDEEENEDEPQRWAMQLLQDLEEQQIASEERQRRGLQQKDCTLLQYLDEERYERNW